MNRIVKAILSKLVWIILALVIFYLIADPFGLIPQSIRDMVSWFGANFGTIAFTICFLVGSYVALQIIKRKKESV